MDTRFPLFLTVAAVLLALVMQGCGAESPGGGSATDDDKDESDRVSGDAEDKDDEQPEMLHPLVERLKTQLHKGKVRNVVTVLRLDDSDNVEVRVLQGTDGETVPWSEWMSGKTFVTWLEHEYREAAADEDFRVILAVTASDDTLLIEDLNEMTEALIRPLDDIVIARAFVGWMRDGGLDFDTTVMTEVLPLPVRLETDEDVAAFERYLTPDEYMPETEPEIREVIHVRPLRSEPRGGHVAIETGYGSPLVRPVPFDRHAPQRIAGEVADLATQLHVYSVMLITRTLNVRELSDIHYYIETHRIGVEPDDKADWRLEVKWPGTHWFQADLVEVHVGLGEPADERPQIINALLRGEAELTYVGYEPLPEPPEIIPEEVTDQPRDEDVEVDPVEDPRIIEDAVDDYNEDPSETDAQDLREAEVESDSGVDAPDPRHGHNPAVGHGGNFGDGQQPGRGLPGREVRRERFDGEENHQRHLMAGLRWLRDHQKVDGGWDPEGFADDGRRNGREGDYDNADESESTGWAHGEAGVTGLATLAFLAAGYTHQDGEFRRTVHNALRYMRSIQANDGAFASTEEREHESFMYNHAICTMAMAEAYGMTLSTVLHAPAQRAVDFLVEAQNFDEDRGYLGWRYGVRPGVSDSSVTGWVALALVSAKNAGLDVPPHTFDGALRHLDDMTGPIRTIGEASTNYRTGYITRAGYNARLSGYENIYDTNHTMSAINIATRFFVSPGEAASLRRDPIILNLANQITDDAPTLDDPAKRDYFYWYKASLAMYQLDGESWQSWRDPMTKALFESQDMAGTEASATHGSWDSVSAWGAAGGRVYTTAINCLTLQTFYRYERVGERD